MPEPAPPLISVVITTYRRARDLDRCIQSALAQPGDFFEVVVADDGSPDETPTVVAAHRHDPRLRDYRNDVNLGMQGNYFKAFQFARGEYIFILTDDDYLVPGALDKMRRVVEAHPEAGYFLSDLPSVDERTGKITNLHRTLSASQSLPPGLASVEQLASSAWVLSRQVLRRQWIDWDTWARFKNNIFFPIILAGRLALCYPSYYLAEPLVRHTYFNRVFWDKFGRDELEIEFNLALDRYRCIRAILHDQGEGEAVRGLIERWEIRSLNTYLYTAPLGFYDLARAIGYAAALEKLREAYRPEAAQARELSRYPYRIPLVRLKVNVRAALRRLPPPVVDTLRTLRSRLSG